MENKQIQISAKTLGEMAMPGFCPRCFWIQRNMKGGMPFSFFPGIFSSIDTYVKKIVHTYFDKNDEVPEWLPELTDAVTYLPALHHSKFRFTDPVSGITVTGMVDDLFLVLDGSHVIIDYKAARHTAGQDELFPMYAVQLNAYALIDEALGGTVTRLYLTYCEPLTGTEDCTEEVYNENGYEMGFSVKSIPVPMDRQKVRDLLIEARKILDSDTPPERTCGCKDCAKLDKLIGLAA